MAFREDAAPARVAGVSPAPPLRLAASGAEGDEKLRALARGALDADVAAVGTAPRSSRSRGRAPCRPARGSGLCARGRNVRRSAAALPAGSRARHPARSIPRAPRRARARAKLTKYGLRQARPSRAVPASPEPVHQRRPAGVHRVRAKVSGYGPITIPVVPGALRTTTRHLDGSADSLRQTHPGDALVALPDRRVVGFRGHVPQPGSGRTGKRKGPGRRAAGPRRAVGGVDQNVMSTPKV